MKRKFYQLISSTKNTVLAFALFAFAFNAKSQSTYTFNYTGSTQTLSLLAGTYSIEAWGGDGYTQTAGFNGKGGYASGILTLATSQTIYINVGGLGSYPSTGVSANAWTFNGGGIGYPASNASYGNGGGASDVRIVGGTWNNAASLAGRVIVAGGGGAGRNSSYIGGNGGGLVGATGTYFSPDQASGPTGGTQTSGGSNTGYTSGLTTATLGMAMTWNGSGLTANFLAGGGGGYYGGASGRVAGGGGSSYIGGVSSGTTIMVGQAGFVPNPDVTGNGRVIIRELCNISIYSSGTNTLNPSLCVGQTVTLTTNAVSNYSWSTGATTSSIIVTPSVSTLYALTATSPSNCTASSSMSITVSGGIPVLTVANPSNNLCLGQTATLTASGALSYTWANAGIVNGQSFAPTATAVYTVTGENGCGTTTAVTTISVSPLAVTANSSASLVCEGTTATLTAASAVNGYTWQPGALSGSTTVVAPMATTLYTVTASDGICSGTQTLLVTTKTTPTIVASSTSFSICPGDQVVLSATGGTSYVWTPGNLTGSSVTVSPATSTLYVVVGTNSVNCSSSASQPVVVGTVAIVNVTANKLTTCSGGSVALTASGANTYVWAGGPSTAGYTVTPTVASIYTVVGTQNNNPCSTTKTISIAVVIPNVTVSSNTSVCIGGTVQLQASGATSYAWNSIPGGTLTVNPIATTLYTCVAQTNSLSTLCPSTHTVLVTVNSNPTVTATAARNTICRGNSNTLTATGAASYVWQGTLGTNSTAIVSPTSTTIYTVVGTSAEGCTGNGQVTTFVSSCNGIGEVTAKTVISVYPNPNNGEFSVSSEAAITLQVLNTLGQVVRVIELNETTGLSIEVSGLAKGVYYLGSGSAADHNNYAKLIVN